MKTFVAMVTCLTVIVVSVAALLYLPSWDSSDSGASVPKIKAGTSILATSGSNKTTTDAFSVGNAWDLVWRYDCSNTPFGVGDFVVHLYDGSTSNIDYVNRDVRSSGPAGAGIEHYQAGESHRKLLVIDTACRWGVIVQAA
ncbi:MAG TPA: hypothetical protein VFC99_17230 [Acidimicrobiia bacterium]|nr:hypothetical protein [Acidimicrobiia bacterium]